MDDPTTQLRKLRKKAERINATLLRDLKPFLGTKLFRRLPDSDDVGNATTTCSCLMALGASDRPLKNFNDLFEDGDVKSRQRVTQMFRRIVRGTWTSSGLLDGNAFSSLLILRTAGLLSTSREQLLTEPALTMTHIFKASDEQTEVAEPFSINQKKSLAEVLQSFATEAPRGFSVDKYPPTSAIAYWFVDATENLKVTVAKRKWDDIISWSSRNLTRQVSLVTSPHDAMKDPIEMAMAACLAQRLKHVIADKNFEFANDVKERLPTNIELHEAVLKSFGSQQKSGIWPKYFPLFNYRKGGTGSNYLFSFELLEIIVDEFGNSDLLENSAVLEGIERALGWCESNRLTYKYRGTNYHGWNSGGQLTTLSQGKPESWATAMVHMFLHKLRTALSLRINRHILVKYGAPPDTVEKYPKPWNRFIDSPLQLGNRTLGVKGLIRRELLKEIEAPGFSSQNKIIGRRSALLFGPPGTSKTTLVRAVAKKIGWPLVELNPSHFLRRGLGDVYSQAEEIFNDLNELSWAVVFFDEMDALAHRRDLEGVDVIRQLLTTSMLPKLSTLHDEARVLFFMATNHQKDFDPAIKRSGRFDLLICMIPPLFKKKLESLERFLPEQEKPRDVQFIKNRLRTWVSSDKRLVRTLHNFTFDEFKNFLEFIGKSRATFRGAFEELTEAEFVDQLTQWGASNVALNQKETEEETNNDRKASRIQ